MSTQATSLENLVHWLFRAALFASATSLAIYIPFKYATQLNTLVGFYAFLFPLSALLAVTGIVLAIKPALANSNRILIRAAVGAVSVLWIATGLMCVSTLTASVVESPASGLFAVFHMVAQHLFLSLSLITFAIAPRVVLAKLGIAVPVAQSTDNSYPADQVAIN